MKALGKLPPFSGLGLVAKLFDGPKKKALPTPLPTPTRDDARAETERRDELRRRRGGAADMVAGFGAEAGAGGKTTLGQ